MGLARRFDDSITLGHNFVAGANKQDFHLKNVNYPRDFKVDIVTDIALASAGCSCVKCGNDLSSTRGVEVGHIFKLGTIFSERQGAFYLDSAGTQKPIVMGCYGIGIGRLLAAAIEQNHDDKGIIWPIPIAPYHIYLCTLGTEDPQVSSVAEEVYEKLSGIGLEVLFDDRTESAGVKFNDADLLGLPVRIIISKRTLKSNSVEYKERKSRDAELIPIDDVYSRLSNLFHY